MQSFITSGPKQLHDAVNACRQLPAPSHPVKRAMLLGMGGSALGGGLIDLLRTTQQAAWPWHIVRDYTLPARPDSTTRVFSLSYSGNTEEVLGTTREAHQYGGHYLAVSAGGKLQTLANSLALPWVKVPPQPEGFQPRFALYFMFGILYQTLARDGLLVEKEALTDVADKLLTLDLNARGLELADFVGQRIPVIYTDTAYDSGVARTWRIKFNENSKVPAIAGAMPEINHNELIAFSRDWADRFAFVLLPDPHGHPRVQHRFDLFADLMTSYGYPVKTVPLVGDGPVEKALHSLMLADWASYWLARKRNTDPVAIPAIQEFKKRL